MKTKNIWICPECGKEVDYGDTNPSKGRTYCSISGETVLMVKLPMEMHEMKRTKDGWHW